MFGTVSSSVIIYIDDSETSSQRLRGMLNMHEVKLVDFVIRALCEQMGRNQQKACIFAVDHVVLGRI